ELDPRREPLPHAGDAEEEGGLHLTQVVRERLASFAEVDDVPGPDGGDDGHQPLGDVAERKVRQDLLVLTGAVELGGDVGGGGEVGVREHDALWRAGCARRVHDDGNVVPAAQ